MIAERREIAIAEPDRSTLLRISLRPSLGAKDIARYRKLVTTAEARRFELSTPPPEQPPRYMLVGKPIATPGNIVGLVAQAKAGKSAFIEAMIAARIVAEGNISHRDCLGLSAVPAEGVVIHIDTEQSPADHHAVVKRALRRAGVDIAPEWLRSYSLVGLSPAELTCTIEALLWDYAPEGIFAVLIDGVADLATKVNDEVEANALVAKLHALAVRYTTSIVAVLHENPGSEKARGHLGSQLERKAESNLRLKKVDGITVVFSEKMRRAPIFESEGPRFTWSDEAGMHVSVQSLGSAREAQKTAELTDLAAEVFGGCTTLRYSEIRSKTEQVRGCAEKTAEKFFTSMKKAGVIEAAGLGMWRIKVQ